MCYLLRDEELEEFDKVKDLDLLFYLVLLLSDLSSLLNKSDINPLLI
jgi:hypothetical protein